MLDACLFMLSSLGMPNRTSNDFVNVVKEIQQFEEKTTIDESAYLSERKTIISLAEKSARINEVLDAGSKFLLRNYEDLEAFERRVTNFGNGPEGVTLGEAIMFIRTMVRSTTSEASRKIDLFISTAYRRTDAIDLDAIEAANKVKITMFKVQRYFDDAAKLLNQVTYTPAVKAPTLNQKDLDFMKQTGDQLIQSFS